jgi:pyridoxamine 5'-phosphate oxidase
MKPEDFFALMNANPAMHLATFDGKQPRVRAVLLYRADANGILFHVGGWKDVYRQIIAHPQVELCFNDYSRSIQVRVSGVLSEIADTALKDEIYNHPSRVFLKPWRQSGELSDFYNKLRVFSITKAEAIWWTMQDNFRQKEPVSLFEAS